MAIQNDNTLVSKGDLKELYTDKIAPYLGGGISYYQCDRSGEELGSFYGSLDSDQVISGANTVVNFIKRNGNLIQPSIGRITIPAGTRVELSFTHSSSGPQGDIVFGWYNDTDSIWITDRNGTAGLKEYCPYHAAPSSTGYEMGGTYVIQWTNETGHDVNISLRSRSISSQMNLREDYTGLSIKEIGRIVDPVKYVSNNSDLQETPVGNIISYMGNSVPKHYLACDGTLYAPGTYPELEAFIINEFGSINYFGGDGSSTWAVPDLRGEFLRGTGTNSHVNQGKGANVGIHQDGTEVPNTFAYGSKWHGIYTLGTATDTFNAYPMKMDSTISGDGYIQNASAESITSQSTATKSYTARPTNTSVKYCIKYESTFHAFFANAAYKVSVPFTIAAHTTGWEDAVLNSSSAIGDTSLISGNYFIAPMDGWYAIGCSSIQNGAVNQFFGFAIDDVYKSGRIGYGSTEIFYLTKGQTVKYASYAGGSAASASAQSGYVNFCLLTSNYNPTIVSADSVYSENEQMIGYWKDGKPLYQKTFSATLTTTGLTTIGNIQNHDVIVDMEGYTEYKTNGYVPLTYAYAADDMQTMFVNNDGGIKVGGKYTGPTSVTVKYTKTTDTASTLQVENSLLLNRPDLWTVGTEYHFGGGLYGKRFVGTFTTASTWTDYLVQLDAIDRGRTLKIINRGGGIGRRNGDTYMPLGTQDTLVYDIWYASSASGQTAGFRLRGKDNGTHSCSYDIWVTYTK